MNITEKAMLVNLNVSIWTARKYDRKVSEEVARNHGTASDAGRYNKRLLPADAESYQNIVRAMTAARNEHYEQTLPWTQDGARILPSANYIQYTDVVRKHKTAFESAVAEFVREYTSLRERAKVVLNGMFRDSDYPTVDDIAGKFAFDISIFPLPTSGDFRVEIQGEEVERIKAEIERNVKSATANATADLYRRLHEAVSHMAGRLADPKAIFRDTLISNVAELCEILPRLNITGDATLEAARKDVLAKLTGVAPETLRNRPRVRADMATKAAEIAAALESVYCGGAK